MSAEYRRALMDVADEVSKWRGYLNHEFSRCPKPEVHFNNIGKAEAYDTVLELLVTRMKQQ